MKYFKTYLIIGVILIIISLLQIFLLQDAHFYSLFSVGLLIILLSIKIHKYKNPFEGWLLNDYVFYFMLLLAFSVIFDQIGLRLGYWVYEQYFGVFDEIVKYVFEWVIPITYMLIFLLLGADFLKSKGISKNTSYAISFFIGGFLIGLITEVINVQVFSWKVIHMPITDFHIGPFFLIFQTVGYWLMILIPYFIYWLVDKDNFSF